MPEFSFDQLLSMLTTTHYTKDDDGREVPLPVDSYQELIEDFSSSYPQYGLPEKLPIPWMANDETIITLFIKPIRHD